MEFLKKSDIRKAIAAKRRALPQDEIREKSNSIRKLLFGIDEYKASRCVFIYISKRNEVDTRKIIQHLLKFKDKRVAVPLCNKREKKMIASEIFRWEELEPGTMGILEPKPDSVRKGIGGEIDLVIVPGVAFDYKGNRIGHGAGYYDEFLSGADIRAIKVGLAFKLQMVESIPVTTRDVGMDFIISEDKSVKIHSVKP